MGTEFEDLEVWKLSFDYSVSVYRLTVEFPESEFFGMTSQLRRSVTAIPVNIAKGKGYGADVEFKNHLIEARGSLEESKCLLMISEALGYLVREDFEMLMAKTKKISVFLNGMIRFLSESKE